MKNYLELLKEIKSQGFRKTDRTGTGTVSLFAKQLRFNLRDSFPLITTKKIAVNSVIHELLWFLRGDSNTEYLHDNNVHIWDAWHDENGDLGPVYGHQWRRWQNYDGSETDQIADLIRNLKIDPYSRRHIVCAWNVAQIDAMKLPPCHCLFQFYVDVNKRLSCHLYQRSADMFLGVPFNIASYGLLTCMIAQCTGLQRGELIISFGDVHLYLNHFEQAEIQLTRTPKLLPELHLNSSITDIFAFKEVDIKLKNYQCHPAIKAPIAV